jgi:predicted membrane channel-forming protein YqfA (hemolysin III family)
MKTWLRLTLVAVSVGGGFCGVATTYPFLFSEQAHNPASAAIFIFLGLLNLYVFCSGLLFVHNPRKLDPLVVALLLQIPVISSPIFAYHFTTGLYAAAGMSDGGIFGSINLGSQSELFILSNRPWMVGMNFVPIVLLVAIWQGRSPKRMHLAAPRLPETAVPQRKP